MQIILSELVNVPSTIESSSQGKQGPPLSFYDPDNGFGYSSISNNFDAIVEANSVGGDCSLTSKPCANVLPELWRIEDKLSLFDEEDVIWTGTGM
eukprot:2178376-Ditylum_brightwellii.AAC.1